ncbi:hypothetical protein [Defluviitalea phaphyphila]|uniref:hypothetical protein n=1 Tax=Defluviitalea phaphyphila TaxID=1473580 RepID=UPI0007306F6E|nr:hypothetical protein [Defluviitalea phaphyphila]
MRKKNNIRRTTRRKNRSYQKNTKEFIINIFLKQLSISIFLFVLIIIFQFIPLKSTTLIMEDINKKINYTMTWGEVIKTIKNTVTYIPLVKNWIKENDEIEQDNSEKELFQDNSLEKDVIIDDKSDNAEDIFLLESELGES